jgi:ornithine--oxo-acid transaminase
MSTSNTIALASSELLQMEDRWAAHNYKPIPVVLSRGLGPWVWDVEGNKYLDCLSGYSAVSHGHCHPKLVDALIEQAGRVTLTSRAFHNEQLPLFCRDLAALCRMEAVLPMNTGAEAVETAVKLARRWGYRRKGIAQDKAQIITCRNNFHGRTTTVISFSSEPSYRDGFGPFTPGFVEVPFGDAAALEAAITPETCAFLVEPIQCEAGILVPPDGYLRTVAGICRKHNVLLMADEIQTGLGRTGAMFACDHESVTPDVLILGKALAGGMYPVSAVVSRRDVMDVLDPGSHGSTFGGNPLGAAVGRAALQVLVEEELAERSASLGAWLIDRLQPLRKAPHIVDIRGRGLLVGIELTGPARPYCERLMHNGVLSKDTHEHVIRIAPPLVISKEDLEWAAQRIEQTLIPAPGTGS